MHSKSDSEGTSIGASWTPGSPRHRSYFVQSPSNHDIEKLSHWSSPDRYFHSPPHHSRQSSTSRFPAPVKNNQSLYAWKHVPLEQDDELYDDSFEHSTESGRSLRFYVGCALLFACMFTIFCLILWGASKAYKPEIVVQSMVFESFNIQAGNDQSGVPTDMLSLNSTVKIHYRNPATYFAVHVTTNPVVLYYFQLKIASGQMKKFTQERKSERKVTLIVQANQEPLYGAIPFLDDARQHSNKVSLPLNLTLKMESRAHILGRLVKSKFISTINCDVILSSTKLGMPLNLTKSCSYFNE